MIEHKIRVLEELGNEQTKIEQKKKLVQEEIKKYKFSSDELIINKWQELESILDSDMDDSIRMEKFIRGAKGLVNYLDKYSSVYSYKVIDFKEAAHENKAGEGSFLLYPSILRLPQRMKKNFYHCLAAPTGVGKTRMALNMSYQYMLQKKVSYYFSIEMTEAEILFSLLAIHLYYTAGVEITKEEMEDRYNSSNKETQDRFDDMLDGFSKYIRYIKLDNYTPKNIFFAQTYTQTENNEIPTIVFIDHFHIMNSDKDIPREHQTAFYSSIATDLRRYVKESGTAYFILGQFDNSEVKSPDYYEATGWKYTGDFAFHSQHYWKLFYDEDLKQTWNLYNAKLRNDLKIYSPYQISHIGKCGAITNVINRGI